MDNVFNWSDDVFSDNGNREVSIIIRFILVRRTETKTPPTLSPSLYGRPLFRCQKKTDGRLECRRQHLFAVASSDFGNKVEVTRSSFTCSETCSISNPNENYFEHRSSVLRGQRRAFRAVHTLRHNIILCPIRHGCTRPVDSKMILYGRTVDATGFVSPDRTYRKRL